MLVWHAPSVSSRTCSTKSVKSSQESLQTAKRKEKKEKCHASQERKVLLKIRLHKGYREGGGLGFSHLTQRLAGKGAGTMTKEAEVPL